MDSMIPPFAERHNQFRANLDDYLSRDPHLNALSKLTHQYSTAWWDELALSLPGIYILTGGRQIGKSTSCKLLIKDVLERKILKATACFYLPCDEIFDAKELSRLLRVFLDAQAAGNFLLIIDEITFVPHWERVIKSLADEGYFQHGLCVLTGSDTLILKEAAMSFPGRRGQAEKTEFHLSPLSFAQYVKLIHRNKTNKSIDDAILMQYFLQYLQCGGYLRAINDYAETGSIRESTYLTYAQWVRGDFLKKGKREDYLLSLLQALLLIGSSQISYTKLTQKIGSMSKDTCMEYCHLLERMDVLLTLQSYDQNKMQGSPRKDRKFHFVDPFIHNTLHHWLKEEGIVVSNHDESVLVESCVASHYNRNYKTFYFKGKGEVDIVTLKDTVIYAIEVKWTNQVRPNDFATLTAFNNKLLLSKLASSGTIENTPVMPVYRHLYEMG